MGFKHSRLEWKKEQTEISNVFDHFNVWYIGWNYFRYIDGVLIYALAWLCQKFYLDMLTEFWLMNLLVFTRHLYCLSQWWLKSVPAYGVILSPWVLKNHMIFVHKQSLPFFEQLLPVSITQYLKTDKKLLQLIGALFGYFYWICPH